MKNEFQHLIITRFNLRNKDWDNTTKNKTLVLTEEWLQDRFQLFENYCFPSVVNQKNQNFEWWVYFDENTPETFKQKIKKLQLDFHSFRPIFVNGMDEFLPNIRQRLNSLLVKYIITSRLDNDDCLHKNYIEFIQNQFNKQSFVALDIIDGYTLSIENKVQLGKKRHLYNPFISVIESNKNAQSVWSRNHGDWKKEKNLQRIPHKRLWMSVIHNANKVNEYTGYGKVEFEEKLQDFGLSAPLIQTLYKKYKFSPIISAKNKITTQCQVAYKDLKKSLGRYN